MFQSPTIGYGILTVFPFDMEWVYDLGSAVDVLVFPHSALMLANILLVCGKSAALGVAQHRHNKPFTQGL